MAKRNRVLIYEDYGCASINILKTALEQYYRGSGIGVDVADASAIIRDRVLNDEVLAFVMPGGAATPYRQKLQVQGNDAIAEYIAAGGAYLGICAGAYYACSHVEFEKDIPELKIVRDDGLLGLVDATAVGTMYKELGIRPYAANQASAAAVNLHWYRDDERHIAYYHGGPKFELHEPDIEVLATYGDLAGEPPAIVRKQYGDGCLVLSGVHIEDSGADLLKTIHALRIDVKEARSVAENLLKNESHRSALFHKVMSALTR